MKKFSYFYFILLNFIINCNATELNFEHDEKILKDNLKNNLSIYDLKFKKNNVTKNDFLLNNEPALNISEFNNINLRFKSRKFYLVYRF